MIGTRLRLILLGAVFAMLPAATLAQSLGDTLAAAYRESGLLRQNEALLRAADEDAAQALAALRPVLSYIGRLNYTDPVAPTADNVSGSLSLQADMLLSDFGETRLGLEAARETVLQTRAQLLDVEQGVLFTAVSAFFNVRRNQAFVQLQANNVELLSEQLRATQDRFEVGEVTRTDVAIAESRLAAARSGLAAAEGDLRVAREEYKSVTGSFPRTLASPPPTPRTAPSLAAAKDIAMKTNPDILAAQRDVTVSELNLRRAEAGLRPSLNGSATFSLDDEGDDSQSVGITLSGPIYQGGQLTSVIRRARAFVEASRGNLIETARNVEQGVGEAWATIAVANAQVTATDEGVRAARVALRGAREEFSVGSRTTLDVLDLEQDLLQAETDRISALIDRDLAAYQLLSAMGRLTAKDLQLGVPIYDPEAYFNAVKNAPTTDVSPQGERLDRILRAIGRE
ncbi:MAG: TolC family outer membrane protein [Pseudomonadota bacterium]